MTDNHDKKKQHHEGGDHKGSKGKHDDKHKVSKQAKESGSVTTKVAAQAPKGNSLYSTPLGREAGIIQAGNKPWLNVVMNIVFSVLLLAGLWPVGLLAAGLDWPPLYTGGVWLGDNVESVNKVTFIAVGTVMTIAAILGFVLWNIYYRKKRRFYLAMTDAERAQVFL